MHFCTFVIIPTEGDVEFLVARALEPFDEALKVEPYRRYLEPYQIKRMSQFYGLDPTDLDGLARKMKDWTDLVGGVDEHGLYAVTTLNPNGQWDWYVIGGRWHGYIKGASRDVIKARTLLNSPHLKDCLPAHVLTKSGTWLSCYLFAITDVSIMNSPERTPNALEAALQVVELGLRVHPLIGKRPIWEDWPSRASSDPGLVERMLGSGQNFGIICDQVAVIDTDTVELATWWHRNMPRTPWVVRTPRGGSHFYYASVPNLRNAVGVDRGWDVRAGGRGYAVGFGFHGRGKQYELIGEATLELPPFDPAWLPAIRTEPLPLPNSADRSRGRIKDLRAYIRRIVSIQGSRGSDACFRVACILRDEGLNPAESLAYMLEWNESCADPPWSVKELEHKVRDAFGILMKGD